MIFIILFFIIAIVFSVFYCCFRISHKADEEEKSEMFLRQMEEFEEMLDDEE